MGILFYPSKPTGLGEKYSHYLGHGERKKSANTSKEIGIDNI